MSKIIINETLTLAKTMAIPGGDDYIYCLRTNEGYLFALIPLQETDKQEVFGIEKFPLAVVPDCFDFNNDLIDRQSVINYIHHEIRFLDDMEMVCYAYEKILKDFPSVFN